MLVLPVANASDQNIQVVYWDTSNSSANGIFNITNSTITDTWNFTMLSVTNGVEYRLYNSSDNMMVSGVASGGSVLLSTNNITDGLYRIVEMSPPTMKWSEFDNDIAYPTGKFNLTNSSGYNYFNISITNPTSGATYWIYNPATDALIANGTSYINATGLADGEYWIFKSGLEQIQITKWELTSSTFEGRFTISNSTPASDWDISISNVLDDVIYRLYLDGSPVIYDSDDTGDGYANLSVSGLVDGNYLIESESRYGDFVNPSAVLLSFAVGTIVLVGGYFINKFRRRET